MNYTYLPNWAMLAANYYDLEIKPKRLLIIQPKLNGIRAMWHHNLELFISRAGNVIPEHIIPHLYELYRELKPKFSLDGELYNHGIPFQILCGLLAQNRIKAGVTVEDIIYCPFDIISQDSALSRVDQLSAYNIPHRVSCDYNYFHPENLSTVLEHYTSKGYEGMMLRNPDAPYEIGRSRYLVKVKPLQRMLVEIVHCQEGLGKFKNMLGALHVTFTSSEANNIYLKIGGGNITTEDRAYIWKNRKALKGRFVTIEYTETSLSGKPLKAQLVNRDEFLV